MKPEIAIALSGGGYRAAMFHLGTLSYLHHLKLDNGEPFLDSVNTISTISGGTITGLWYMLQYAKGNVSEKSFAELYNRLKDSEVIAPSLENLLSSNGNSFIKEMISVYDKVFFDNACFDVILDAIDKGHIHHFSANGTDFSTGYAFRFQASRKIINTDPRYNRGVIGNNNHRIPWDVAGKVKLSEILAVSSCFPGGFEPLYFPSDFTLSSDTALKDYIASFKQSIPLMDGGIVDNQGIEPILLANSQMQFDDKRAVGDKNFPCHDLIIVSDVTSPKEDSIKAFHFAWLEGASMKSVDCALTTCSVLFAGASIAAFYYGYDKTFGVVLCLAIQFILLRLLSFGIREACRYFLRKAPVTVNINSIWSYSFGSLVTIAGNRLSSLLHLSKAVFMKPIRQMRYKALYENDRWANRRITNTIYELTSEFGSWKDKLSKGRIPEWLAPSDEIQENSKLATSMGTSLWFTDEDKERGIPEALLACGQYNICMNLLEYIQKLKKNNSNTTEAHQYIMQFEDKLRADWEVFKKNPRWMVSLYV